MSLLDLATSRAGQLVTNVLLASVWFVFAARHVAAFLATSAFANLVIGLTETVLVILFLLRKPATNVSADWMSWAVGIGGTFAPLLFSPTNQVISPVGTVLTVIGAVIMFGGVLSLNRSFGIVAAQREIKTGGLYQLVRHPIYASYVFSFTGYILVNWSPTNLALCALALALMVARVHHEETLLSQDESYRAFKARTPYRLLPYVW